MTDSFMCMDNVDKGCSMPAPGMRSEISMGDQDTPSSSAQGGQPATSQVMANH